MKLYFYLILFVNNLIFVPLRAQIDKDSCSEMILKGYVVKQYKKEEIQQIKSNPLNRVIDYYERSYFLPVDTDILNESVLDSINILNSNEIYFLPSEQTNALIKKYCGIIKDNSFGISTKWNPNATFFQTRKQSREFVYELYYCESRSLKCKIPNTEYNSFQLNIPFNQHNEFVTCYFIFQNILLQRVDNIFDENFKEIKF